jgi:hypothetical protein
MRIYSLVHAKTIGSLICAIAILVFERFGFTEYQKAKGLQGGVTFLGDSKSASSGNPLSLFTPEGRNYELLKIIIIGFFPYSTLVSEVKLFLN